MYVCVYTMCVCVRVPGLLYVDGQCLYGGKVGGWNV